MSNKTNKEMIKRLVIQPQVSGFDTQISYLVSMLEHVRVRTLKKIKGLSIEQLDYHMNDRANSIGILLKHLAAMEYIYQLRSFENRSMNEQERIFWKGAITGQLIERSIKGNTLQYYLDLMQDVRSKTIEELKKRDDRWLIDEYQVEDHIFNNYWCWFHVMEDELHHVGQIQVIINELAHNMPSQSK